MTLSKHQKERLAQYGVLWEHWTVGNELGAGSFGTVYEIRDDIGTVAALKMITIEFDRKLAQYGYSKEEYLSTMLEKKMAEIKLLSKLSGCPNIVTYQDYSIRPIKDRDGALDGYDVLIRMEKLCALSKLIEPGKPMAEQEVVQLGRDICRGLRDGQIAHRDIKPDNIFVSELGANRVYKLGDLGESKMDVGRSMESFRGTPLYMAPEIYNHQKKYNPKVVDLYSLGIVMYEMLSGKLPLVDPKNGFDAIQISLDERMSGKRIPMLPATKSGVEKIIAKALEFEPEKRWQSPQEMLDQLANCMVILQGRGGNEMPDSTGNDVDDEDDAELIAELNRLLEIAPEDADDEESLSGEELNRRANEHYEAKDYAEALRLYRLAADKGYAYAMYSIGWQYEKGLGIEKNQEQAYAWYRRAADGNERAGIYSCGCMLRAGRGCAKDSKAAYEMLLRAADRGHHPAENAVGEMLRAGEGVDRDNRKAFEYFKKAAEGGSKVGMNHLGDCYDYGDGVARDSVEAVKWYRKSAEAGFRVGMYNLGYAYMRGRGVRQDASEGVRWYKKAAELGDTKAMNSLGVAYEKGRGVAKNEAEAFRWYEKAANAGHAAAMQNVAMMYLGGHGVGKNYAQARAWLEKSKQAGNAKAQDVLNRMNQQGM